MKKIEVEKRKAVRIIAYYEDFDPKGWNSTATEDQKSECWKLAFYEMWRMQMTWGYAYEIEARESRQNGVHISICVKEGYAKNAKDTMEAIGFRDVRSYEEYVAVTDGFDLDDDTYSVFVN